MNVCVCVCLCVCVCVCVLIENWKFLKKKSDYVRVWNVIKQQTIQTQVVDVDHAKKIAQNGHKVCHLTKNQHAMSCFS